MAVNYNDGKWHGWNGGECPVNPETVVECMWINGDRTEGPSSEWKWASEGQSQYMIAFRVIKEHREPREFWVIEYEGKLHQARSDDSRAFKVREVLE